MVNDVGQRRKKREEKTKELQPWVLFFAFVNVLCTTTSPVYITCHEGGAFRSQNRTILALHKPYDICRIQYEVKVPRYIPEGYRNWYGR